MKKITEKQLNDKVGKLREYMVVMEAASPVNLNNTAQPQTQPSAWSDWSDFVNTHIWGDPPPNANAKAELANTRPVFPTTSNVSSQAYNSSGNAIGKLQTYLNANGFKGQNGNPLTVDSKWGKETGYAAKAAEATLAHSGDLVKMKEFRKMMDDAANTAKTHTPAAPTKTSKPASSPAAAPTTTSTAPVSSGDPALDARIADNAAYFKNRQTVAQPTTPATTQTAYNSSVTPTNLTYARESKQFTNTIDEMKYYSEILAEAQLSELNVGKALPKIGDALSGVKAGLQGKHIPQSMDPATGRFGSTSQVAKDARSFTKEYAPKIGAGIGAAGAGVAAYQGDGSNAYSTGTSNPVLDTIPQGTPKNPYGNVPQAIQHPHPDMTSAQDDMASTDQFNSDQAAQKLNDLGKPTASLPNMNTGNLPQSPKLPGTSTKAQDAPKPNPKVKEAQKILIQFGYLPKGADTGVMDNVTKDAQRQFQTAYKSGPQPVNPTAPMMEHVSFGEMDSLARIIQLAKI